MGGMRNMSGLPGGVQSSGSHSGSGSVRAFSSSPARRMAVYGRQKWKRYFASMQAMPLSASAKFNSARMGAVRQGFRSCRSMTVRAMSFQVPRASNQKKDVAV